MQQLLPHTLGTLYTFAVGQNPAVDLTAIPITVVLDGPNGVRFVLRWLNGGTDGVLSVDTLTVTFTILPTWSAANLTAGQWDVRFLSGAMASAQVEIGYAGLVVQRPKNGPLPTT